VTLYAPGDEEKPNIRLSLLFGQRAGRLSDAEEVRVRGPESGRGPLVVINPVDGTTLLGYGQRFDACLPGQLRTAWLAFLKSLRALRRGTIWCIRAARHIPGALVRGLSVAAAGCALALVSGVRTLVRGPAAAIAFLATSIVRLPRVLGVAVRAMGRALVVSARAVGRALAVVVDFVARVVVGVPRVVGVAVLSAGRVVVVSAGAMGRALVVSTLALGQAVRRLPAGIGRTLIAGAQLLAGTPRLARAGLALARRAGREIGRLPAHIRSAVRSATAAIRSLAKPTVLLRILLLYVRVPLAVVVVGGTGIWFAANQTSGPTAAIDLLSIVLVGLGGWCLLLRLGHYLEDRKHIHKSQDATVQVLWARPPQGLTWIFGSGTLAVGLPDAGTVPSLMVSLFGGQEFPSLSPGQQIGLSFRPGHSHGLVVVDTGGLSRLIGFAQVFGPYKLSAPDVVRRARHVLRRDLIVYLSCSRGLVERHRAFSRTLNRGGHAVSAEVVGSTRPRWYERVNDRDSVWLRLATPDTPRYVRMRLLGRQDGTALIATETVDLYGPIDGRGSIIAVGSRRRSTLLGVGEPWTVSEQSAG
jgi:hypothetical protein